MTSSSPLRARIERHMAVRGIASHAALARQLGWPYVTYRAYRDGRRALPATRAVQLARALHTSVENLLHPS